MKKLFRYIAGGGLMAVGVAGLLLPLLPGWPLIFSGLSMISPERARRLQDRLWRKLFKQQAIVLRDWSPTGVIAGFTTRHFPQVLHRTSDLLDAEKQRVFASTLAAATKQKTLEAGRFVFLEQVHGDRITVLDDASAFGAQTFGQPVFARLPQADGVVTNLRGVTLVVMTADCLSVFLRAGGGRRHPAWIGLVHAGWRGTKLNIVQKAARILCERAGVKPASVRAAFGPAISAAHYEVGEEFAEFFPAAYLSRPAGKLHFDLAAANRAQLISFGVRPLRIQNAGICTVAENRDFY